MIVEESQDPRVVRSRQRIIATTIELLADKGVSDTSIEAIAEASGVAKTTIYRHWPTKDALVLDAFATLAEKPVDPDTGSLRGDLERLAVGLATGLRSGGAASLLPSLIEAAEHNGELAELHKEFARARNQIVLGVIARARDRGEVRRDVSDREVAELIAGPLFYRRIVEHRAPTDVEARRLAAVVTMLVHPDSQE